MSTDSTFLKLCNESEIGPPEKYVWDENAVFDMLWREKEAVRNFFLCQFRQNRVIPAFQGFHVKPQPFVTPGLPEVEICLELHVSFADVSDVIDVKSDFDFCWPSSVGQIQFGERLEQMTNDSLWQSVVTWGAPTCHTEDNPKQRKSWKAGHFVGIGLDYHLISLWYRGWKKEPPNKSFWWTSGAAAVPCFFWFLLTILWKQISSSQESHNLNLIPWLTAMIAARPDFTHHYCFLYGLQLRGSKGRNRSFPLRNSVCLVWSWLSIFESFLLPVDYKTSINAPLDLQ